MTAKTQTRATHATQAVTGHLAAAIRAQADADHAQYPQYAGHWDDWRLAEITRDVKAHGAYAFRKGDLVLVSPEVWTEQVPPRGRFEPDVTKWPERQFATAYSARNKVDTAVRPEWVREIQIVTD